MTMTSLVEVVAHRTDKNIKNLFSKEEKICYKMVCCTLYLHGADRQKLCYKVRIYTDQKLTFFERGLLATKRVKRALNITVTSALQGVVCNVVCNVNLAYLFCFSFTAIIL